MRRLFSSHPKRRLVRTGSEMQQFRTHRGFAPLLNSPHQGARSRLYEMARLAPELSGPARLKRQHSAGRKG
jgi:transposase